MFYTFLYFLQNDPFTGRILFLICHLFGMSSANSNPLLYGFFNDNFRKEFRHIWHSVKAYSCCRKPSEFSTPRLGNGESKALDKEPTATAVHYKKAPNSSKTSPPGEVETLITQV